MASRTCRTELRRNSGCCIKLDVAWRIKIRLGDLVRSTSWPIIQQPLLLLLSGVTTEPLYDEVHDEAGAIRVPEHSDDTHVSTTESTIRRPYPCADMIVLALIAAAFMNGDWLTVVAHTQTYLDGGHQPQLSHHRPRLSCSSFFDEFKAQLFWAMVVGYGVYFGLCGYLEWKYYVKGRGEEAQWKCQPNRHLPRHLFWDQIKWGCIGLMVTNAVSAAVATHVSCGGYSKVYIGFGQYPWWWWILQWPVIFFQQDYVTYWIHRSFHSKFLFKHFHSIHHRYFQPTPWSVTAIHPLELISVQLAMVVPIFIYPVHWLPFYGLALYTYYHGIVQHSGIAFKAQWWQPWQPDCMFHDNHHQYCHVNYGFNCSIWDKIHGSMRKIDRCYSEHTDSWGSGRPLADLSSNERHREIQERITENPMAYREQFNPYLLKDADGDVE